MKWPFARKQSPPLLPAATPDGLKVTLGAVDDADDGRVSRLVDMSRFQRRHDPANVDESGNPRARRARALSPSRRMVTRAASVQQDPMTLVELGEFVGAPGTNFAGDLPMTDPNEDMFPYEVRGLGADPGTYEAVYRGDSVIFGAVNQAVDMISGATIEFTVPEIDPRMARVLGRNVLQIRDEIERDADRLNAEVLLNADVDFPTVIREQARDLLTKGFFIHEAVVDVRQPIGRQVQVEYRAPSSVQGWVSESRSQRLLGFTQQLPYGGRNESPMIDIRRCIYSAGLASGANFEGVPRIRPAVVINEAWGEWINTGRQQRRRFGAGFPIFRKLENAATGKDVNVSIDQAARNFFSSSKAYVSLPAGVVLELLQTQADTVSVPVLEYFDKLKREALGAMIFALGQGQTGSWALGDVLGQLYLKQLHGFGEEITSGWSRFARLVIDSTAEQRQIYPTMTIRGLVQRSPVESIEVVGKYVEVVSADRAAGGVLTPDDLADLRYHAGLKMMRADASQVTPRAAHDRADGCGCGGPEVAMRSAGRRRVVIDAKGEEFTTWRPLRPLEEFAELRALSDSMDTASQRIAAAVGVVGNRHRARFLEIVDPLIDARDLMGIAALDVSDLPFYVDAIREQLARLSGDARRQMLREIERQLGRAVESVPQPNTNGLGVNAYVDSLALLLGRRLDADAQSRMRDAAIQVASGANRSLLTRLEMGGAYVGGVVLSAVTAVVNESREAVAAEGPEIEAVEYSAVLDQDTCDPCAADDGREFRFGSAEYESTKPPNKACLSNLNRQRGNMCRCLYFFRFASPR